MSHTDYRTLINQGRKSGLRTSELYRAMTSRPPQAGDHPGADSNGFIPTLDSEGHRIFQPLRDPKGS